MGKVIFHIDMNSFFASCEIAENPELKGKKVAVAHVSLDKKGMDESQVTGASSSYARKYALNGLFAIDDTKELDGDNSNREVETLPEELIKAVQETKTIDELSVLYNANKDDMSKELKQQFNNIVSNRKQELSK